MTISQATRSAPRLVFHHIGVACTDILDEQRHLESLGYAAEGEVFEDTLQGIRGLFMAGQTPRIELIAPLGHEPGVLRDWLARGVKFYHLAYTVRDLADAIASLRVQRAKLVLGPVPAVAFGGRHVAFLMQRNQMLVELISER